MNNYTITYRQAQDLIRAGALLAVACIFLLLAITASVETIVADREGVTVPVGELKATGQMAREVTDEEMPLFALRSFEALGTPIVIKEVSQPSR